MLLLIKYYVVLLLYSVSKIFLIKKCPVRTLNFPIKSRFFRYLSDLRCMRKFENVETFIVLRWKTGNKSVLRYRIRTRCDNIRGYLILCRDTFFDIRSITIGDIFFVLFYKYIDKKQTISTIHNIIIIGDCFFMVDKQKVEQAIRLLLEGIGEDTEREGLKDTPDRIARMCMEIYGGLDEKADQHLAKQFEVENNEMVLEKDITFYSMCEHHLMPFYGKAHIAYIPNGRVTGLSKLARTVDVYARRPQIQERLTVQIADALERALNPRGVMVMLEAEHTCMTMRGIKKPGSKAITTVTRGDFRTDRGLQKQFLSMVKD